MSLHLFVIAIFCFIPFTLFIELSKFKVGSLVNLLDVYMQSNSLHSFLRV